MVKLILIGLCVLFLLFCVVFTLAMGRAATKRDMLEELDNGEQRDQTKYN